MTRQEAERRIYPCIYGDEKRKELLDALVALGVITFDRRPAADVIEDIVRNDASGERVIAHLKTHGYKIVEDQSLCTSSDIEAAARQHWDDLIASVKRQNARP